MSILVWAGAAQAEGLTSEEFLALSDGQRHWWYAGAIYSIGHLVYLHDKTTAQCVWRWMPDDPEEKNDLLNEHFKRHPDHAPTSVLLALLQRDCGALLPN